jgi:hypothetical protein
MTLHYPDEAGFELGSAPLTVIALGLRRGAFKNYSDLQSLIAGREHHIEWEDDVLDMPFFVAAGLRGLSVKHDTPMSSQGSREFLRRCAVESGLGGKAACLKYALGSFSPLCAGTETGPTSYAFCRTAMTRMEVSAGNDLTKVFVHHHPKPGTISLRDLNRTRRIDPVGVAAGSMRVPRTKVVSARTTPYLLRTVPEPAAYVSLEQARELDVDLNRLCRWRDKVEWARGRGDEEWRRFEVSVSGSQASAHC